MTQNWAHSRKWFLGKAAAICMAVFATALSSGARASDPSTERAVLVTNGVVKYAEESIDQARAYAAAHPQSLARYGALSPGHTADFPVSKAMAEGRFEDAIRLMNNPGTLLGRLGNQGGRNTPGGSDDNGGADVGGTSEEEGGTASGLDDLNPDPQFNGPYISFQGPNTCGCEPPDPILAVGTTHVLMGINDVIRAADKTTGTTVWSVTWETFFSSVNPAGAGSFTSDPKVFFDPGSQRYFATILMINNAQTKSWWMLAASTSNNITDSTSTWRKWAIDPTTHHSSSFADYPGFGFDNDAVYITSNMFNTSGTSFLGVDLAVIPKAQLLVNTPSLSFNQIVNVTTSAGSTAFTIQPCLMYGSPPPSCYLASVNSGSGSALYLYQVNNPLGSPTLTKTSVSVSSYSTPPGAAQSGTSTKVVTNDTRLINAVWRNNSLWCAHETSASSLCSARWYQVNTSAWPSASLTQSGTYNTGSAHYYYPSVAVDQSGNMAMGFTRSNSSEFPSAWHTSRLAGDPAGTLAAATVDHSGTSRYTGTRWGDYSGTVIDPVDNSTFWVLQEFATGTSTWSTWATSFQLAACSAPVVNSISNQNATCGVSFTSSTPSTSSGTGPITWSLAGSPPGGMTINSGTGVVSWTGPTTVGSPFTIQTKATNSCGSDTKSWTLTVAANNPTVNSVASGSRACGVSYTSPTPSTSGGAGPFTWSLLGSPPVGMTINPVTGVVSWSSPVASATAYTIMVQASSSCGSGTQSWTLTVKPGDFTGDGVLNSADVSAFVDVLLGNSSNCAADVNLDGNVDGLDIVAFENAM